MIYKNETSLTPKQIHFLRSILDGKREISEGEIQTRVNRLSLNDLVAPCAVICISPYYSSVPFQTKDDLICSVSDYICRFLQKNGFRYYCLTNSYDNFQVILPTDANQLTDQLLDSLFIRLHQKILGHFNTELFIGIGSVVTTLMDVSRSALEAMEMLAFKNQYSDRGVINIVNTYRFMHYSIYGEDIMFARVIGRFKDGDLGMMSSRLTELIDSIKSRPGISSSSIQHTFIELAVNILHIASNANVDVDSVLEGFDLYNWILKQTDADALSEWLIHLSRELMSRMETGQETKENEIILQACNYIASNLGNPNLGLQTVSNSIGLSSSYFSQLFKTEKGIGLINYINEQRILQAQQLLRVSDLKTEDIALQLGFSTASYFGRVFKKSTGLTPSEYRKQNKYGITE